jgi:hypothetical protein
VIRASGIFPEGPGFKPQSGHFSFFTRIGNSSHLFKFFLGLGRLIMDQQLESRVHWSGDRGAGIKSIVMEDMKDILPLREMKGVIS